MARESIAAKRARVQQIIEGLHKAYPDAHCELNYSNAFELLIATILSAQCTDRQVNIVTADLFKKYCSTRDFADAPIPQLENDIRRIGLFRNKAKSIKRCCAALVERHAGQVPNTMEALIELDGVGRKTANVVLGNAFNVNDGIVVDTHVTRLSHRLGLTQQNDTAKIEKALQQLVPREHWTMASHWLIWHGRRRCFARNPDCVHCEILHLCPTGQKRSVTLVRLPNQT